MPDYAALANGVLLVHATFVLFVVLGGILVLRWPRLAWIHLPSAIWGALVEFAGWICPLTPLEDHLRRAAGEHTARGDFIEGLLVPLLYPSWLTREIQFALGAFVVLANAAVYGLVVARHRRAHRSGSASSG